MVDIWQDSFDWKAKNRSVKFSSIIIEISFASTYFVRKSSAMLKFVKFF